MFHAVGMHFALELSCVKLEMLKPSLMTLCFHTVHIHPQVRVLYLTDAAGQAKIEVKCKNKKHQVLLTRCLTAADTKTLNICSTLLDNSASQLYLQGLQLDPHGGRWSSLQAAPLN